MENWYQEELGITEVIDINLSEDSSFCFAVSDGVASSDQSQHCSKAVVKAIYKCTEVIARQLSISIT